MKALLDAIASDPASPEPRLVLADWCEAQGDRLAAEYLRRQEALAALRAKAPEREGLLTEVRRLADTLDPDWLAKVDRADRYTVLWPAFEVDRVRRSGFEGGVLPWVWGGWNRDTDFGRLHVSAGDWIYPLCVRDKQVFVATRLRLAGWVPTVSWKATEGAPECVHGPQVGRCAGAVVDFGRQVPVDVLSRMTFRDSRGKERAIKGVEDGKLQRSVYLQGVFRLTLRSAMDLEAGF